MSKTNKSNKSTDISPEQRLAEIKAKAEAAKAEAKKLADELKAAKLAARGEGKKGWTRRLPPGAVSTSVVDASPKLVGMVHGFTAAILDRFTTEYPACTIDELIQGGMSRYSALVRSAAKRAAEESGESPE